MSSREEVRYVYLIQVDGAQSFHVCECVDFLIQVSKQKNAHVFPVGMVCN